VRMWGRSERSPPDTVSANRRWKGENGGRSKTMMVQEGDGVPVAVTCMYLVSNKGRQAGADSEVR